MLFPAPPGITARFKYGEGDAVHYDHKPVVAFDEDGRPYVIPETGKRLVLADSYRNYVDMDEDPYPPIVALIPPGGWRVEYTDEAHGTAWSEPLAAWGLKQGGSIVPLATDSTGHVDDFDLYGGTFRIYHPEEITNEKTTGPQEAP